MGAVSLTGPEAWIVVVAMLGQCQVDCQFLMTCNSLFFEAMRKPTGTVVQDGLAELQ